MQNRRCMFFQAVSRAAAIHSLLGAGLHQLSLCLLVHTYAGPTGLSVRVRFCSALAKWYQKAVMSCKAQTNACKHLSLLSCVQLKDFLKHSSPVENATKCNFYRRYERSHNPCMGHMKQKIRNFPCASEQLYCCSSYGRGPLVDLAGHDMYTSQQAQEEEGQFYIHVLSPRAVWMGKNST